MRFNFPEDFSCVDGIFIPSRGTPVDFEYSDGDAVEERIHQAILTAADRSSSSFELERHMHDWPSEYHLSRMRSNLLRPFNISRYEKVLEIGAGCGAITRYLGETCTTVTALEGSPRRIAIVRDRCAGLGNLTCVCASLGDVRFGSRFNLVLAIGVWEYAGKYLHASPDPWLHFLELATEVLAPDGVLVIAVENQLGLKYFAGSPEDHTGKPYEGIEGYYSGTRVRTFGRKVVADYLSKVGMNSRFFLPFPDYKQPKLVINEDSVHLKLSLGQWYDSQKEGDRFADTLVLPEIEKNGLMADLANSFLILAARGNVPAPPWEAASYSIQREKHYQTETLLSNSDEGYVVTKSRLFPPPTNREDQPLVVQNLMRSRYVRGEKLALCMLRSLRDDGMASSTRFGELLAEWDSFLVRHALPPVVSHEATLPADFIDGTPFNIYISEEGMEYIDREWVARGVDVTVGWILFRGLYLFLASYGRSIKPPVHAGSFRPWIRRAFDRLGYRLTEDGLRALIEREATFQGAVLNPKNSNITINYKNMLKSMGPESVVLQRCLSLASVGSSLLKSVLPQVG